MKYFVTISIVVLLQFLYPKSAEAIIFLPALILIPIAKIIAIVIAGFSIPATGLGILWGKLSKKPILKTISIALAILLFLALFFGLFLKFINPNRPLF